jgi:hypothetical protein
MADKHKIRAVAFEHGDHWVAQCLEYDIATQAKTLDDLLYELERILVAHVMGAEGANPFAAIPKAPQSFWRMYERAVTRVSRVKPAFPLPVSKRPHLEVRKAAA